MKIHGYAFSRTLVFVHFRIRMERPSHKIQGSTFNALYPNGGDILDHEKLQDPKNASPPGISQTLSCYVMITFFARPDHLSQINTIRNT
jgi:hypothetical protein